MGFVLARGDIPTSGLSLKPVFSSKTQVLNKTVLSLVENFWQIYEWTTARRARFYLKARVFDENTGVRVKPDVWEYPLRLEQNPVYLSLISLTRQKKILAVLIKSLLDGQSCQLCVYLRARAWSSLRTCGVRRRGPSTSTTMAPLSSQSTSRSHNQPSFRTWGPRWAGRRSTSSSTSWTPTITVRSRSRNISRSASASSPAPFL